MVSCVLRLNDGDMIPTALVSRGLIGVRFYGTLLGTQLTDDPRLSKRAKYIELHFIQRELTEGLKEEHSSIN